VLPPLPPAGVLPPLPPAGVLPPLPPAGPPPLPPTGVLPPLPPAFALPPVTPVPPEPVATPPEPGSAPPPDPPPVASPPPAGSLLQPASVMESVMIVPMSQGRIVSIVSSGLHERAPADVTAGVRNALHSRFRPIGSRPSSGVTLPSIICERFSPRAACLGSRRTRFSIFWT